MTIDICRTFVTGHCKGQYCRSYSNFLYRVLVQAHVQINIVFGSEASDKSLTIIFFGLGKITTKKQKNRRKKAGQYVYISHVYIGNSYHHVDITYGIIQVSVCFETSYKSGTPYSVWYLTKQLCSLFTHR
jgi:hypothetical protein